MARRMKRKATKGRDSAQPRISDRDVRELQETLLKSVLTGEPLPGSVGSVNLPDLSFITRQPQVLLSDANISGPLKVPGLNKPLRTVSVDALRERSRTEGDLAYLQFEPPEIDDDSVRLTLAGQVASADPRRAPLGLSAVRVRFRKTGDQWEAVDGPVISAS